MLLPIVTRFKNKNVHTWLGGYLRHWAARVRAPRAAGPKHLLFALCDHYEPLWGNADASVGQARVQAWREGYPAMTSAFRDADGKPPQHTFFFPGEQYAPTYLETLAELVRAGFGEVEFHLHHDQDKAENLRRDLHRYLQSFAKHGHLAREKDGRLRFAFIHGNWALANARKDGRWCGVDQEIPLLFEAGCYADYTFPSAPDECQPAIVNQLYWPTGDFAKRRGYEHGERARVGERKHDRMLMIQGPLALSRRPGKLGLRIESAAITANDPPTPARIRSWVRQHVHIEGCPEWVFVKVHTHGAPEAQAASLLGEGGRMLHRELGTRYNDGKHWVLHYVTAREMFNIALAAMDGKEGNPANYRDFELNPPPIRC